MMQGNQMNAAMQECIQNCKDCHAVCVQTVLYCLQQGGPHAESGHLQALLDCAQMCQTSEDFMLRSSPLHSQTCGVCAQACLRCAQSCEQFGSDQQMQTCVQLCRRCAQSCQEMARMA
jgi:hypothetical protein